MTTNILTTHVGSLPRPNDLIAMLYARDKGQPVDEAVMTTRVREVVTDVVARQRQVGLDVINDGEASKAVYATYVQNRLTGYTGTAERKFGTSPDFDRFPDLAAKLAEDWSELIPRIGVCEGPITYQGQAALQEDLDNLRNAVETLESNGDKPADVFVSAASPGIICGYLPNRFYANDDDYVWAIAEAMKEEYDAIVAAGFVLQLDCPDLTGGNRNGRAHEIGIEAFREGMKHRIAAINHATRDIPADRIRMHICWGNSATPHIHDVPMADIVDEILQARPAGLSFEGANPRHAHEWKIWETTTLPEDKYLIPGVIDSTTNFVEHPDLVAERILRYASIVGPERVMAGVDCGLATAAALTMVDREVAWVKLESLVEGTRLANEQLNREGLRRAS